MLKECCLVKTVIAITGGGGGYTSFTGAKPHPQFLQCSQHLVSCAVLVVNRFLHVVNGSSRKNKLIMVITKMNQQRRLTDIISFRAI